MSRTVIEIVVDGLTAGGFDGLVNGDAECGCLLDDLAPCAGDFAMCKAAYRGVDPNDSAEWRMYARKEDADQSTGGAK